MQLKLDDAAYQRLLDYCRATTRLTNGKHDFRIPHIVADDWSRKGYCVLSTNGLARQFGSTRRTMCLAIARLVAAGAIREIGRTVDGRAMFVPCLELGDHFRARMEANADVRS